MVGETSTESQVELFAKELALFLPVVRLSGVLEHKLGGRLSHEEVERVRIDDLEVWRTIPGNSEEGCLSD